MIKTNQSPNDFYSIIGEIQHEYSISPLINTSLIDTTGEIKYVMIANKLQATKILYNVPEKCITTQTIYKSDLDIFKSLQDQL